VLTTSHQYAGQNRVGLSSTFGPITAIRFPDDDARADLALRQVIGGIQAVHIQEAQQMRAMFAQPSSEADIFPVFQVALPGDQSVQLGFQGLGPLSENGWIQAGFLCFQLESRLQKRSQLLGKPYRPAGFCFLPSLSGLSTGARGIFV